MTEYIDKQAVIDEVDEWYNIYSDSDTAREALSLLKKAIKKISPEDVRPVVRGKWKITPIYIKCLECGECFVLIPQNFCPSCGADMRGTQDE